MQRHYSIKEYLSILGCRIIGAYRQEMRKLGQSINNYQIKSYSLVDLGSPRTKSIVILTHFYFEMSQL